MLGPNGLSALVMDVTGPFNDKEKSNLQSALVPVHRNPFLRGSMELVPPAGLLSPALTPSGHLSEKINQG